MPSPRRGHEGASSSLPNVPRACVQKQALRSIHAVARAHLHTQGRRARSSHLPGKRVATRHDENQLTRVQSVHKIDHNMHIMIIQQQIHNKLFILHPHTPFTSPTGSRHPGRGDGNGGEPESHFLVLALSSRVTRCLMAGNVPRAHVDTVGSSRGTPGLGGRAFVMPPCDAGTRDPLR